MDRIPDSGATGRAGGDQRRRIAEVALLGRSVIDCPALGAASKLGHFFVVLAVHCSRGLFGSPGASAGPNS